MDISVRSGTCCGVTDIICELIDGRAGPDDDLMDADRGQLYLSHVQTAADRYRGH